MVAPYGIRDYIFMPMKSAPSSAFTLIELLVVIAIIAILMGLLFPATNAVLENARKTQDKNNVVQIANAVIAYETEYGRLPAANADTVSGNLLNTLRGSNVANSNPRMIVFLDAPNYKKGRGGVTNNEFRDAFYGDKGGNVIRIKLDDDYNNEITGAGPNNETLRKRVAVWTTNTGDGDANRAKRRMVTSWD